MITLLFDSNLQFQDKSGAILTGGILNVYYNSSSDTNKTSAPTYSDAYGTVRNPFDIILDNNGRALVYVASDYVYRLEVSKYTACQGIISSKSATWHILGFNIRINSKLKARWVEFVH